MTTTEILIQLQSLGSDSTKRILMNHGAREPIFGVKIADLKKIQKKVKKDYQLALDLYATGIYDAMYLAGMVADDLKMTKKDLKTWAAKANCAMISEYTVAPVAAESLYGWELAREWIESKTASVAACGWTTFSFLVAIKDDADLDLDEVTRLLERVERTVHDQPDRVRYTMNGFVIAVGCYVKSLTKAALQIGGRIGRVAVDMGSTACKVPGIVDYIKKVQARDTIGKKRKTAKC